MVVFRKNKLTFFPNCTYRFTYIVPGMCVLVVWGHFVYFVMNGMCPSCTCGGYKIFVVCFLLIQSLKNENWYIWKFYFSCVYILFFNHFFFFIYIRSDDLFLFVVIFTTFFVWPSCHCSVSVLPPRWLLIRVTFGEFQIEPFKSTGVDCFLLSITGHLLIDSFSTWKFLKVPKKESILETSDTMLFKMFLIAPPLS